MQVLILQAQKQLIPDNQKDMGRIGDDCYAKQLLEYQQGHLSQLEGPR